MTQRAAEAERAAQQQENERKRREEEEAEARAASEAAAAARAASEAAAARSVPRPPPHPPPVLPLDTSHSPASPRVSLGSARMADSGEPWVESAALGTALPCRPLRERVGALQAGSAFIKVAPSSERYKESG